MSPARSPGRSTSTEGVNDARGAAPPNRRSLRGLTLVAKRPASRRIVEARIRHTPHRLVALHASHIAHATHASHDLAVPQSRQVPLYFDTEAGGAEEVLTSTCGGQGSVCLISTSIRQYEAGKLSSHGHPWCKIGILGSGAAMSGQWVGSGGIVDVSATAGAGASTVNISRGFRRVIAPSRVPMLEKAESTRPGL